MRRRSKLLPITIACVCATGAAIGGGVAIGSIINNPNGGNSNIEQGKTEKSLQLINFGEEGKVEQGSQFPTNAIVEYYEGTTKILSQSLTPEMVENFSTTNVGKSIMKVTFNGVVDYFSYEVMPKQVVSVVKTLEISGFPTTLKVGDSFPSGVTIKYLEDGAVKSTTALTSAMVTGFDTTTVGTKTLTISYNGASATINCTVVVPVVKTLKVEFPASLNVGDTLPNNIVVEYYENDSFVTSDMLDISMISGFNTTTPGVKTLTVYYNGASTTVNYTVVAPVIKTLEISGFPATLTMGDGFPSGVIVKYLEDGVIKSTTALTSAMVTDFDTTTPGVKTLTVNYKGISTTVNYNVKGVETLLTEAMLNEICNNIDSERANKILKYTYYGQEGDGVEFRKYQNNTVYRWYAGSSSIEMGVDSGLKYSFKDEITQYGNIGQIYINYLSEGFELIVKNMPVSQVNPIDTVKFVVVNNKLQSFHGCVKRGVNEYINYESAEIEYLNINDSLACIALSNRKQDYMEGEEFDTSAIINVYENCRFVKDVPLAECTVEGFSTTNFDDKICDVDFGGALINKYYGYYKVTYQGMTIKIPYSVTKTGETLLTEEMLDEICNRIDLSRQNKFLKFTPTWGLTPGGRVPTVKFRQYLDNNVQQYNTSEESWEDSELPHFFKDEITMFGNVGQIYVNYLIDGYELIVKNIIALGADPIDTIKYVVVNSKLQSVQYLISVENKYVEMMSFEVEYMANITSQLNFLVFYGNDRIPDYNEGDELDTSAMILLYQNGSFYQAITLADCTVEGFSTTNFDDKVCDTVFGGGSSNIYYGYYKVSYYGYTTYVTYSVTKNS